MTLTSRPTRVIATIFAVALLAGFAQRAAGTSRTGATPVASPSSAGPTDPASPPGPARPLPATERAELAWLTGSTCCT